MTSYCWNDFPQP